MKDNFKGMYLFNAAELLCMSTISGPAKQFIEWLSQYIAPGMLALKAPCDTCLTGVLFS